MTNKNALVAYLDEKWFYVSNNRRKIKILPLGDDEEEDADFILQPKVRNRRYPVKVMFLGIVINPNDDHNFDGRIHLERVSKSKRANKTLHHQRFSFDINVNTEIKNDGWRDVITKDQGITIDEHIAIIGEYYKLHPDIIDCMVFNYKTLIGENRNSKEVYLSGGDILFGSKHFSTG